MTPDKKPSKKKTLADELSSREQIDVAILAIVIVISTIFSAVYAPVFKALAESNKWLEFILFGVVLILFVFLILAIALAIIKRYRKHT